MLYCNSYSCKNKSNSLYINWLVELLGPVLLGSKPTEIVNIPFKDSNKETKINEIKTHFNNCKKIDIIFIDKKEKGIRILFINRDSLENRLSCRKSRNFLKFLGYPKNYSLDSYINHLVIKLHEDSFPDEIGIFLGYPLKDVLGFMGYGKNELHSIKSWRVYGNPTPSEEIYNLFLKHREAIRTLLTQQNAEYIVSLF